MTSTIDNVIEGKGPFRIGVDRNEERNIREKSDSFYLSAKSFAAGYGTKFVDLALSRIGTSGKTTILISLGGAEPLGTLLEMAVEDRGLSERVEIKYVKLTRDVVKAWHSEGTRDGHPIFSSGIGRPPPGYGPWQYESNPKKLLEFVRPFDLFSNNKLIVLDTGLEGTVPEAIAYLGREISYGGEIEGVLLYHKSINREHTLPVIGLNQTLKGTEDAINLFAWTMAIDFNNLSGRDSAKSSNAFQRSRFEIKDGDLTRTTTIASSEKHLKRYKSTLLGLRDGLSRLRPKISSNWGIEKLIAIIRGHDLG